MVGITSGMVGCGLISGGCSLPSPQKKLKQNRGIMFWSESQPSMLNSATFLYLVPALQLFHSSQKFFMEALLDGHHCTHCAGCGMVIWLTFDSFATAVQRSFDELTHTQPTGQMGWCHHCHYYIALIVISRRFPHLCHLGSCCPPSPLLIPLRLCLHLFPFPFSLSIFTSIWIFSLSLPDVIPLPAPFTPVSSHSTISCLIACVGFL